jgi:hypothetical protein
MAPARRQPFRAARIRARVAALTGRPGKNVLQTQAGGSLTKEEIQEWANDDVVSFPKMGRLIDVYIEQLCHYINALPAFGPGPAFRRMFMMPQSWYTTIVPLDGEVAGQALLRAAGVSAAEFRQLEYFFVPMEFNEHSSLVAISPANNTIELLDSATRTENATVAIFNVIIRFLILELGNLADPGPWKFMHSQAPHQASAADCGNYTCLYARALALNLPIDPVTDVGQGVMRLDNQLGEVIPDEELLKLKVVAELFEADTRKGGSGWTEDTHPVAATSHLMTARWAPTWLSGPSEEQHNVYSAPPVLPPPPVCGRLMELRRRTGKFDHLTTNAALLAWCNAQPPLIDAATGARVPRIHGALAWSWGPYMDFRNRMELREMHIAQGVYP